MINNGNIKIMGYYLRTENVQVDTAIPYRSLNTTKIFNGKEINTRGEWNGISFSFDSFLHVPAKKRNMYDKIFKEMMSKPVEVVSQDFGGLFYAQVIVKKNISNGNPHGLVVNFSVKQLPITSDYYPNTTMKKESRNKIVK